MDRKEKKLFCIEATVLMIAITTVPIICNAEEPLPYWLEGTILDGNTRVLITWDGEIIEGINPNDYEYILSANETLAIESAARANYINLYGVDPLADIDPVTYNGITWPTGNIDDDEPLPENFSYYLDDYRQESFSPPHTFNGRLLLWVTFPTHNYRPWSPLYHLSVAGQGFRPFNDYAGVVFVEVAEDIGYWNADDVESTLDLIGFYNDLIEDMSWRVDGSLPFEVCIIVLGIVRIFNLRAGYASLPGHFAVVNVLNLLEYPPKALITHEVSHCFRAENHIPILGPECVMDYYDVHFHHQGWCDDCRETIQDNIN